MQVEGERGVRLPLRVAEQRACGAEIAHRGRRRAEDERELARKQVDLERALLLRLVEHVAAQLEMVGDLEGVRRDVVRVAREQETRGAVMDLGLLRGAEASLCGLANPVVREAQAVL